MIRTVLRAQARKTVDTMKVAAQLSENDKRLSGSDQATTVSTASSCNALAGVLTRPVQQSDIYAVR
ncbi:hypothetical protein [Paraburkholderia sp. UCT31]|uniref:hypothetical protein n=1 Tax=Paraburkholderia sp. UCT31 TaxID=2615209 RepID=UPI001654CF05|nr:hypothetical protein [Paraburkholderia sp. UCT31]